MRSDGYVEEAMWRRGRLGDCLRIWAGVFLEGYVVDRPYRLRPQFRTFFVVLRFYFASRNTSVGGVLAHLASPIP